MSSRFARMNGRMYRTSDLSTVQGDALLESGIAKIADFGLSKVMSSYSSVFPRPASDSCCVRSSVALQPSPAANLDFPRPQAEPVQPVIDSQVGKSSCCSQESESTQGQCNSAPVTAADAGAASAARTPGWNDDMRGVAQYLACQPSCCISYCTGRPGRAWVQTGLRLRQAAICSHHAHRRSSSILT